MTVCLETEWLQIKNQIERAMTFEAIRESRQLMPETVQRWENEAMGLHDILSLLNRWHDTLMRHLIEQELQDMERDGWGTPAAPFCWLLLGSSGRSEATLHPDQDHALIYQSGAPDDFRDYFHELAERVSRSLAEAGYPYCEGYVMAANPRWNHELDEWRDIFQSYLDYPNWDNIRYLLMAADMRGLFGNLELVGELQKWFAEQIPSRSYLFWQAADRSLSNPIALSSFNQFRTDRWGDHMHQVNIKEGGYLQIVKATRLWSMSVGIAANSTEERIAKLQHFQVWSHEWADQVREAFRCLTGYRIWGNYVDPAKLTEEKASSLKQALKTAKQLQKWTSKQFRKTGVYGG